MSCHEEDAWAADVSPPDPLQNKEHRADSQRGTSWRRQCDTIVSQFVKREHPGDSPSHLYQVLTVEQTTDIKTEPDGDERISSSSTKEAEISCGEKSKSYGLKGEATDDWLEE